MYCNVIGTLQNVCLFFFPETHQSNALTTTNHPSNFDLSFFPEARRESG